MTQNHHDDPADDHPDEHPDTANPRTQVWRVERVETVPMTPEQHETAVRLLARLIVVWIEEDHATTHDDHDPANNARPDDGDDEDGGDAAA